MEKSKNKVLYIHRSIGLGLSFIYISELYKILNKLRFKTNKQIKIFSIKYGRELKEINFWYYYYTVILRYKKWFRKPFYTIQKHLKIYES